MLNKNRPCSTKWLRVESHTMATRVQMSAPPGPRWGTPGVAAGTTRISGPPSCAMFPWMGARTAVDVQVRVSLMFKMENKIRWLHKKTFSQKQAAHRAVTTVERVHYVNRYHHKQIWVPGITGGWSDMSRARQMSSRRNNIDPMSTDPTKTTDNHAIWRHKTISWLCQVKFT